MKAEDLDTKIEDNQVVIDYIRITKYVYVVERTNNKKPFRVWKGFFNEDGELLRMTKKDVLKLKQAKNILIKLIESDFNDIFIKKSIIDYEQLNISSNRVLEGITEFDTCKLKLVGLSNANIGVTERQSISTIETMPKDSRQGVVPHVRYYFKKSYSKILQDFIRLFKQKERTLNYE